MAGKREIKTTLATEGEREFKRAMSDAASAIRELSSEQKLAEAQFEATGDAEQYAAEKTRILKDKIAEQQKAVKTAKQAIEKMKSGGIDPNSKAMQTWRTKLNNAQTSLVKMENQLNRTESELAEQGDALYDASADADDYKNAMNQAAKSVDFTATITAINNVRNTIGGIIGTAAQAAKSLINLERGAAGWADELATNAARHGLSVVEEQGWQYASELIDSDVETIRGAYKRLNKSLDEPTDGILESLNELNVANLELSGGARETMDVFWDVIDALGRIENTSRRDQIATELLGKSYDDLLPLINEGSAAYKALIEEGKEKAVSEENIAKLTELDDTLVKLQATFDKTQYTILAELAPAFTQAAEAATTALESFNEFLDSEEGQAALEDLRGSLTGIADSVKDVNWKKAMDKAAGVIARIAAGLRWLANNGDVVVGAVTALGGAWAGLTVAKDVLSVLQLLNTIKWAQIIRAGSIKGAGKGIEAAASNAANATGVTVGKKALSGLKTAGSAIASGIANLGGLPALGGFAALAGGSIAAGKLIDENSATKRDWERYEENVVNQQETLLKNVEDERAQMLQEIMAAIEGPEEMDLDADLSQPFKEFFKKNANALMEAAPELDFWNWIKFSADTSNGLDDAEIENVIRNIENADVWAEMGREAAESLASAIVEGETETTAAAEEMATATAAAADASDLTYDAGYNTAEGYANGIIDGMPLAVGAAESLGALTAGTMTRVMEIQSPSKVMARLGRFVSMGFAKGIEENVNLVERATNRMAYATMGRTVQAAPAAGAANGAGGMVHVTLMLDGQAVGDAVTPYVDGNMAAQVSRRR